MSSAVNLGQCAQNRPGSEHFSPNRDSRQEAGRVGPSHTWSQMAENPDSNTFYIVPTWPAFIRKTLESPLR